MKNIQLNKTLEDLGKGAFPDDLQPWVAMQEKIQAENFHNSKDRSLIFKLTTSVGFALVLVTVFGLASPQNSAFAKALKSLFKIGNAAALPTAAPETMATPTYAPTFEAVLAGVEEPEVLVTPLATTIDDNQTAPTACYDDPYGYACEIARAENKIGFNLKEFAAIPNGFRYESIYALGSKNPVQIQYEWIRGGMYISLTQGLGGDASVYGGVVPEDAYQQVRVGEYLGEVVLGRYIYRPGSDTAKWTTSTTKRLRWVEEDRWFEIRIDGSIGDTYDTTDAMIALALDMVYDPEPVIGPQLDYLTDMADVQQVVEFNFLTPSILPEGFRFDFASYDEEHDQLRLEYMPQGGEGIAGVLIIQSPLDAEKLIGVDLKGELVNINGYEGIMISQDAFSYIVTWQTADMNIWLNVYSSDLWYGATFTPEQILEIARSFK